MKSMRDTECKIQTGLRMPQSRYEELKQIAERAGISINAAILLLVDIGLLTIHLGTEESNRSLPHSWQRIAGQYIR